MREKAVRARSASTCMWKCVCVHTPVPVVFGEALFHSEPVQTYVSAAQGLDLGSLGGSLHLFGKLMFLHVFFPFSPITDSEDDGESEAAKQLIQPIAEKIIAKYKAKEEEAPLLFFVAGEVSGVGGPGPSRLAQLAEF